MNIEKNLFFGRLGIWLAILLVSFTVEANQSPERVIDQATGRMVKLLNDPRFKKPEALDELRSEVDAVLHQVVDFPRIARGVMGGFFSQASAAQIKRFEKVFRNSLVDTYSKALRLVEIDSYEVKPVQVAVSNPDRAVVSVDIRTGSGDIYTLVYSMVKTGDDWRLVNVLMDGVNLGQVFRQQFVSAMSTYESIDQVIDNWSLRR